MSLGSLTALKIAVSNSLIRSSESFRTFLCFQTSFCNWQCRKCNTGSVTKFIAAAMGRSRFQLHLPSYAASRLGKPALPVVLSIILQYVPLSSSRCNLLCSAYKSSIRSLVPSSSQRYCIWLHTLSSATKQILLLRNVGPPEFCWQELAGSSCWSNNIALYIFETSFKTRGPHLISLPGSASIHNGAKLICHWVSVWAAVHHR